MKLLTVLAACAALVSSASAAEIGQPAPNWKLTLLDGRTLSAADCKGKVVVLDFWATWCGPCKHEIPSLEALQKKYGARGLIVVGVSIDGGPQIVRQYLAERPVAYTVGMSNDPIYAAFDYPDVVPTTYLIDRQGIIRDRQLGEPSAAAYDQKVAACLR